MGFIFSLTDCCTILVKEERFESFLCFIIAFFRAQMNIFVGFVLLAWIITPAAYYTNMWDAKMMPIVSNRVFTRDGHIYNISAVLDSNLRLNETAYEKYGST